MVLAIVSLFVVYIVEISFFLTLNLFFPPFWLCPAQVTFGGDQANSVGPSYQEMSSSCKCLALSHFMLSWWKFGKKQRTVSHHPELIWHSLVLQQVQVIGLLCRTPQKESRHELLRRVAAGGGVFKSENGLKVQLPAANLNDIASQADDLLEVKMLLSWSLCSPFFFSVLLSVRKGVNLKPVALPFNYLKKACSFD